jgi:hypothetical protein
MRNLLLLILFSVSMNLQAQSATDTTEKATDTTSVNVYESTKSSEPVPQQEKQVKPTSQPKIYGGTEFIIWTGYQTNSNMKTYEGKVRFHGGASYGAELAIAIKPILKLRLGYSRLESDVEFISYYPNGFYPNRKTSYVNEYYNLGFEMNIPKGRVVPFGLFNVGATTYKSDMLGTSSIWTFHLGLGGGAKIFLTDFLGVRLQARALLPFKPQGLSIYAGSGGAGVGVNSRAMILADFSFGVFLHLSK